MPVGLKDLRQRVLSVREIRRVTATLQRVAAARLVGDRKLLQSCTPYTEGLTRVVGEITALAAREPGDASPAPASAAPVLLLLFGSEQGLCGSFNADLLARLKALAEAEPGADVHVYAVGRVMRRQLDRLGWEHVEGEDRPPRDRREDMVDRLTARVVSGFQSKRFGRVVILHMQLITAMRHEPLQIELLPPPAPVAAAGGDGRFICEPPTAALLDQLLPEYVRQQIEQAFLHTAASENAARQAVMGMAADNAENILDDLTRQYRRVRQELITTEMLELIGSEVTEEVGALTG